MRAVLQRASLMSIQLATEHTAWLFIDQQLAIDLGGVHGNIMAQVNLQDTATSGETSIQTVLTNVPDFLLSSYASISNATSLR